MDEAGTTTNFSVVGVPGRGVTGVNGAAGGARVGPAAPFWARLPLQQRLHKLRQHRTQHQQQQSKRTEPTTTTTIPAVFHPVLGCPLHCALPPVELVPEGQVLHWVAPGSPAKVLAGQSEHVGDPAVGAYLPALHALHP